MVSAALFTFFTHAVAKVKSNAEPPRYCCCSRPPNQAGGDHHHLVLHQDRHGVQADQPAVVAEHRHHLHAVPGQHAAVGLQRL